MLTINPSTSIVTLHREGVISNRVFHNLISSDILTVGDLLAFIKRGNSIRTIRNLGGKSEAELRKILQMCEVEPRQPVELPKDAQEFRTRQIITKVFDVVLPPTENPNLNGFLGVKYPDADSWFNLVTSRGKAEVMGIVPSLSKEDNVQFRQWHMDLLKEVLHQMEKDGLSESSLYKDFSSLQDSVKLTYQDFAVSEIVQYFISGETDQILQDIYEILAKECLSTRGLNLMPKHFPNYKDILCYFDKPVESFTGLGLSPGRHKTLYEIQALVQRFKSEAFNSVMQYADNTEILQVKVKREYPYLTEDQIDFVVQFIQENKVRPVFYLLYNFILSSQRKGCIYFSLHYGFKDGVEMLFKDIAKTCDLTAERVRQIVSDRDSILNYFPIKTQELDYYNQAVKADVITEDSAEFKELVAKERIPDHFGVFTGLCTLVLDNYEICDVMGYRVLMTKSLRSLIQYKPLIQKFNRTYQKNALEEAFFPFSYFLPEVPTGFYPNVQSLLTFFAKDKINVTVTDDGVLFGPSKVDVGKEVYNILAQAGEPMYMDQIFDRFKALHPSHKFHKPSQIRIFLYNDPRIKAIGKQSMFALESWDHVYFGSIRDLLYETLQRSDTPMHLSDLFEIVKEHFPTTNIKSILSNMACDSTKKFVQFEDGYFGITEHDYPTSFLKAKGKARYKFDRRLQMFRTFVETRHRFPFFNGDDEEAALQRWLYNATHDNIDVTPEQIEELNIMLETFAHTDYPKTTTEYVFLTNCQRYKEFLQLNHKVPTQSTAPELYQWFKRSKENFPSYQDQRKGYFLDLMSFLSNYSIKVDLPD